MVVTTALTILFALSQALFQSPCTSPLITPHTPDKMLLIPPITLLIPPKTSRIILPAVLKTSAKIGTMFFMHQFTNGCSTFSQNILTISIKLPNNPITALIAGFMLLSITLLNFSESVASTGAIYVLYPSKNVFIQPLIPFANESSKGFTD